MANPEGNEEGIDAVTDDDEETDNDVNTNTNTHTNQQKKKSTNHQCWKCINCKAVNICTNDTKCCICMKKTYTNQTARFESSTWQDPTAHQGIFFFIFILGDRSSTVQINYIL
ncbi:MAG: hypothetical protein GY928_15575 [Colwellia sp.]|nr:hypothetical protein [Colwellia sp.]